MKDKSIIMVVLFVLLMWFITATYSLDNKIEDMEDRLENMEFVLTWPQCVMRMDNTEYLMWESGGPVIKYDGDLIKRNWNEKNGVETLG